MLSILSASITPRRTCFFYSTKQQLPFAVPVLFSFPSCFFVPFYSNSFPLLWLNFFGFTKFLGFWNIFSPFGIFCFFLRLFWAQNFELFMIQFGPVLCRKWGCFNPQSGIYGSSVAVRSLILIEHSGCESGATPIVSGKEFQKKAESNQMDQVCEGLRALWKKGATRKSQLKKGAFLISRESWSSYQISSGYNQCIWSRKELRSPFSTALLNNRRTSCYRFW